MTDPTPVVVNNSQAAADLRPVLDALEAIRAEIQTLHESFKAVHGTQR